MSQLTVHQGSQQMLPAGSGGDALSTIGADRGDGQQINVVALVRRLLRGRFLLAIVLSTIGAAGGAVAGYFATTPKYEATSIVRVQASLPKIMFDTEKSAINPMFASFVGTQAALMRQARVINKAMSSDAWVSSLGRSNNPKEQDDFRDALSVTTNSQAQELIFISFRHPDRQTALVAVDELVRAYLDTWGKELDEDKTKLNVLEERKRSLESLVGASQDRIRFIAGELGTEDPTLMQDAKIRRVVNLENELNELKARMAALGRNLDNTPVTAKPGDTPPAAGATGKATALDKPKAKSIAEIASVDKHMNDLMTVWRENQVQLDVLLQKGMGEKNKAVMGLRATIDSLYQTMEKYAQEYNDLQDPSAPKPLGGIAGSPPDNPEDVFARLKLVDKLRTEAQADAVAFNNKVIQLKKEQGTLVKITEELNQVELRIREIKVEGQSTKITGRVSAELNGKMYSDARTTPAVDKRLSLAAAGFVFGGLVPLAAIMGIGLMDGRYRYADDARAGGARSAPLLGILPNLPPDLTDPEQAAAAAHSVHQIRLMLALDRHRKHGQVYAMTSPSAGDGKTSLTLSLGMSFASAGYRTLLVDFDMIAGGLSTNLGQSDADGVLAALDAGDITGTIVPTATPGLSLLPTRRGDEVHVGRLSGPTVGKLVEQLREQFDVVLMDTGPILGSLEAALASKEADGVVLVVGRGQQRSNTEKALEHLATLGARVRGMVFNRAHAADFRRSMSSMSVRSIPMIESPPAGEAAPQQTEQTKNLGPLPAIVLRQARK